MVFIDKYYAAVGRFHAVVSHVKHAFCFAGPLMPDQQTNHFNRPLLQNTYVYYTLWNFTGQGDIDFPLFFVYNYRVVIKNNNLYQHVVQEDTIMRKYEFNWDLLGDVDEGRANLGSDVNVEIYRLMQFTLRDIIEEKYGSETADEIFYAAGRKAGFEFYKHYVDPVSSVDEFVRKTQEVLKSKKIGILRIEEALLDEGMITLTVDEDLDCSGLPELDYEICIYDEGFVAALLEGFTHEKWTAKEIDCWCTGARTCRFKVEKE